jgi:hypothetical protein
MILTCPLLFVRKQTEHSSAGIAKEGPQFGPSFLIAGAALTGLFFTFAF